MKSRFSRATRVVAALLTLAFPTPAWTYGAIAVGGCVAAGNRWGTSYSQPSAQAAARFALQNCGDASCQVVMPLYNQCGALALDLARCGPEGSGASRDIRFARTLAYRGCREQGGSQCTIVTSFCD